MTPNVAIRDQVAAISVVDVPDHLFAAILAEVDVEVGHRHAFRVEEPLEQQAVRQGVDVRDFQRVGDERSRARSAAGADRNAVGLRPFDEVRNDEEVAGELHLDDDVEFELQAILVHLVLVLRDLHLLQSLFETRPRLDAQLLVLRSAALGLERRQDGLALVDEEGAAAGDLLGVFEGFRNIGEHRRHLFRRTHVVAARRRRNDLADIVELHLARLGADNLQKFKRVVAVGRRVPDLAGADEGHSTADDAVGAGHLRRIVCEIDDPFLDENLLGALVARPGDLDEETVAEPMTQPVELGARHVVPTMPDERVKPAVHSARQSDDPLDLASVGPFGQKQVTVDQGLAAPRSAVRAMRGGEDRADVLIALGVLRQEDDATLQLVVERQPELGADDRLQAVFRRLLRKVVSAIHVSLLDEGDGRYA
jgi:hypothetical protein